jgi:low affinity Fe/Cu permease
MCGFMAKKRRRVVEEKEEEYEFVPSVFDEREYILKDIYGTKVLFVVMGLAVLVGIIGALLCINVAEYGVYIATAVSFLTVLLMKKILMLLKFRADLLELKTMLMNYLLFLTLALGLCIVMINAPFV